MAAEAFADFAAFLQTLAAEAHGGYAIGEERYSRLLQEKELLGYGAVEMRERGRVAYAELDAEMQSVAAAVPGGSSDWRGTVEMLNQNHPSSPEEMRVAYEDWTERARQFLIDNALVTLPEGEECIVDPSPPFQRPIMAVASYASPPAFKPSLTGHFFVPFPPEGTPPEEVQKRLATNSFNSMPTIAVHEAYPGHHWHITWFQSNAPKIRRVLGTSYFTEGWGLYAERVMRQHGFFADPGHDLCHLDARIFRAARIVVDTSLHIGDMTFEEAVEFMRTGASLTEPTARAEVGPLLHLAHAGVLVPHRLPRDRAHPRRVPRRRPLLQRHHRRLRHAPHSPRRTRRPHALSTAIRLTHHHVSVLNRRFPLIRAPTLGVRQRLCARRGDRRRRVSGSSVSIVQVTWAVGYPRPRKCRSRLLSRSKSANLACQRLPSSSMIRRQSGQKKSTRPGHWSRPGKLT